MPSRYVRAGWLSSDRVRTIGDAAEVLLLRLILVADDFGRYDARPTPIQRACWPLGDDDPPDGFPAAPPPPTPQAIAKSLEHLEAAQLIVRYQAAGKPYLYIPNFGQRTRSAASKYPDPPDIEGKPPDSPPTTGGQTAGKWQAGARAPRARSRSVSRSRSAAPTPRRQAPVDNPQPIGNFLETVQAAAAREKAKAKAPRPTDTGATSTEHERNPAMPPIPAPLAPRPANGLPPEWASTSQGIETAGASLGMAREEYETDPDYIDRINARLALG